VRLDANRVMGLAIADVKFTGVHHIKLPVSDLARSREWYERVLGYTVEREFPDGDGVVHGVGGRLPGAGVPVALRQTRRPRPATRGSTR
jgi:catechol 2,3-dioxygenase-like lactoylglutathione lyase family enzyme